MDIKRCDKCKKEVSYNDCRRIIIYEKESQRFRDGNYHGHTKLDLCLDCLKELGYITDSKEKK